MVDVLAHTDSIHVRKQNKVMGALALAALLVMQATSANAASAASSPSVSTQNLCRHLRASGASDIAKATMALQAKLSLVLPEQTAAFERIDSTRPHADGLLDYLWPAERYLERATQQIGSLPNDMSPVQRALMVADRANAMVGYVAISNSALLPATPLHAGAAMPSDEQVVDYALDFQQIAWMLNTLVLCNPRQPR